MPSTIDATVGGSSANSYVTQSEATDYLDDRLNTSAWTDADSDDKDRALIEARRELDLFEWDGIRVSDDQALDWPRDYAVNPDATISDPGQDHPYFEDDEIPERVKDAQIELALEFLKAGTTDLAVAEGTQGVVRKRVDVLETEYAQDGTRLTGLAKFHRIIGLIAPLLEDSGMLRRA